MRQCQSHSAVFAQEVGRCRLCPVLPQRPVAGYASSGASSAFTRFILHSWYTIRFPLTLWSRVLHEKLTGPQLVKKFPAFCGTRRFITLSTRARHLSLSLAFRCAVWFRIFCREEHASAPQMTQYNTFFFQWSNLLAHVLNWNMKLWDIFKKRLVGRWVHYRHLSYIFYYKRSSGYLWLCSFL
jgi:hypothetical protein